MDDFYIYILDNRTVKVIKGNCISIIFNPPPDDARYK